MFKSRLVLGLGSIVRVWVVLVLGLGAVVRVRARVRDTVRFNFRVIISVNIRVMINV